MVQPPPVFESQIDDRVFFRAQFFQLIIRDELDASAQRAHLGIFHAPHIVSGIEGNVAIDQHQRAHMLQVDIGHRSVVGDLGAVSVDTNHQGRDLLR